jgi:hypothetical protein
MSSFISSCARLLLASLFCLGLPGTATAADNAVAGMVLDLQGTGQIADNGKTSKLQLLAYLKPQMQLSLDAGSKASVSLYATKSVYQLTGPAVVEIEADKLVVKQGQPPVVKSKSQKLVAATETVNLVPGAVRMREMPPRVLLLIPQNGGVILDNRPAFKWDALEAATYEVTVLEAAGRTVAQSKTADSGWQLPENQQLANGKTYRWTVAYTSPRDNKTYRATGEFSVIEKSAAAELAALKPAEDGATEDWVLYALVLQNRNMNDEARNVWRRIAAKRPDLQKAMDLSM